MIAINARVTYDVTHLVVHHLLSVIVFLQKGEELDDIGILGMMLFSLGNTGRVNEHTSLSN